MLRGIVRTIGVFGTIFAAGYVAQKYFGWEPGNLLDRARDRLDTMRNRVSDAGEHLSANIHDRMEARQGRREERREAIGERIGERLGDRQAI